MILCIRFKGKQVFTKAVPMLPRVGESIMYEPGKAGCVSDVFWDFTGVTAVVTITLVPL